MDLTLSRLANTERTAQHCKVERSWVSFHHGGGVWHWLLFACWPGFGGRRNEEASRRLNRVLTNDPGLGVARHVDAG
jgi:urocanate hydratase